MLYYMHENIENIFSKNVIFMTEEKWETVSK